MKSKLLLIAALTLASSGCQLPCSDCASSPSQIPQPRPGQYKDSPKLQMIPGEHRHFYEGYSGDWVPGAHGFHYD